MQSPALNPAPRIALGPLRVPRPFGETNSSLRIFLWPRGGERRGQPSRRTAPGETTSDSRKSSISTSTATRFLGHVKSYEKADYGEMGLPQALSRTILSVLLPLLLPVIMLRQISFATPWGSRCHLASAHSLAHSKSQPSLAEAEWVKFTVPVTGS
jgi:hypothetical protein